MKKIMKKVFCGLFAALLLLSVEGLPAQAAKSVYYQIPFDDYDNWYTGVDGSTDGFSYGYLNSPSKFIDYTYTDGVATMFFTGKTIEWKTYQYGSTYGWPFLYYTYDEALELDLTGVSLEYDVYTQAGFNLHLCLQKKDGTILIVQLSQLADLSMLKSIPHEEEIRANGSLDLLSAIRKNYNAYLDDLGLMSGNTVLLKSIEIQIVNETVGMPEAKNEIHTLRMVKDSSAVAQSDVAESVTLSESGVTAEEAGELLAEQEKISDVETAVGVETAEKVMVDISGKEAPLKQILFAICTVVAVGTTLTVTFKKRK